MSLIAWGIMTHNLDEVILIGAPCSKQSKVKCSGSGLHKHFEKGTMNEEECHLVCDADYKCKFFFWSIDDYCALFNKCNDLENSNEPGTIFRRVGGAKGCPGGDPHGI